MSLPDKAAGFACAEHISDGALAAVLALDVGLQLVLVGAQTGFDGVGVEVAHPAFGFVDLRALLGGGDEGLGIEGHCRLQVHAGGVFKAFEAGVKRYPGIALARGVDGAAAGVVLDEGFDPDVFKAEGVVDACAGEDGVGHAALAEDLLGGIGGGSAAHPVLHALGGDVDGAVDVARRNAGGAQQGDEQAGGVKGVAALFIKGVLRALHAAVAGQVVDVVVDPLVDFEGVVFQALRQRNDGRAVRGFGGGGFGTKTPRSNAPCLAFAAEVQGARRFLSV